MQSQKLLRVREWCEVHSVTCHRDVLYVCALFRVGEEDGTNVPHSVRHWLCLFSVDTPPTALHLSFVYVLWLLYKWYSVWYPLCTLIHTHRALSTFFFTHLHRAAALKHPLISGTCSVIVFNPQWHKTVYFLQFGWLFYWLYVQIRSLHLKQWISASSRLLNDRRPLGETWMEYVINNLPKNHFLRGFGFMNMNAAYIFNSFDVFLNSENIALIKMTSYCNLGQLLHCFMRQGGDKSRSGRNISS